MTKWYEKICRYGQTNLTEIDPEACDLDFWKKFWKKTGTGAIIVNAGGIVAYYPSQFKMHYRAKKLGEGDLFGDFVDAGRKAGLTVLARMDINRAIDEFYQAQPDWFARKKDGSPFITQGRYLSCLNSGYYKEYIPGVLKEIIEGYHPEGFTDNSWTGIPRKDICYCDNCRRSFRAYSGGELPEEADYRNPVYRRWIQWSYQCRTENWDLFNRITAQYGGEDCLWLGMIGANVVNSHSFCDLREVARRSKIIMVDSQSRDGNGFEQNSLNGMVLHQMAGWDKIIPESMAAYARGQQTYRRAANPPLELRLWMLEGIAGGITPWWHVVGGAQEDRRIFDIGTPVLQWHEKYERYLYNRIPIANAGVLWSQNNVEFSGGIHGRGGIEKSWRGINMALTRMGIPFLPINAEDIADQTMGIDLLILPELAVLSQDQAEALEAFAARGGSILALGNAGIMEKDGLLRRSSRLESLLGVRFTQIDRGDQAGEASWENPVLHNYLRFETKESPVFRGFENTATLPMGGKYLEITPLPGTKVLATYIPPYPIYPPEFAWTALTHTDKPVITEHALSGGGKALYAAWDLDAAYGRCALPDHGDLLGNMVNYLLGDRFPVRVQCRAYIDFKFYRQDQRVIIHLVNPNHTGFAQGYAEENLPVGPVTLTIKIPGFNPGGVKATEAPGAPVFSREGEEITLTLDRLEVHQLLILE
ncbi:MAG: hypothetical protein LBT95_03065 [Treponema sp.]|nr:hypothetical protein [Treponema sp.]